MGAYFDPSFQMIQHVNNIIKSCYYQILTLSKFRKYLTIESSKKLIHAFVSSCLDNLNSLLIKLPDTQLKRLQLIQNHAARLVMRQKKSSHVTSLLIELHWLPIECRIQYKLLLLVYKCLHNTAPACLPSSSHMSQPVLYALLLSSSWSSPRPRKSMEKEPLQLLYHTFGMNCRSESMNAQQLILLKVPSRLTFFVQDTI